MSPSNAPPEKETGLRLIAVAKIAKAVLFTGIGIGLFRSLNSDLGETARKLAIHLRIDPESHIMRLFLEKVAKVNPKSLRTYGLISYLFALELYVEGIGLWLNQAWAKYMVVIATGFFLPEEAYGCIRHFSWERVGFLALNLVVLLYVIWILCRKKRRRKGP